MQSTFKKRILFVGMPDMALVCMTKLVAENVNIISAVPPDKKHSTYKLFCDYSQKLDVPVISYENGLNDSDFLDKITALQPDLAVVCSYGKLFPPEFLAVAKDGFVNVHPSLLPKYRGGNPYSHVILNNEKITGVTLHFMDNHFDTGDIIAQKEIEICDKDTMGTLFNRLSFLGADMLMELLCKYENGEELPTTKQPLGEFPKAPSIDANSTAVLINWNKSAKDIERFIRALNPFLNAGTRYRGNYLKIHSAYVEDNDSLYPPGTIVSTDENLGVACKKGVLHICVLQAASYFVGEAKSFIELTGCKPGERLGNE